eukprot:GHVL01029294.1.p1 GENE.GHVL01029294.1~~GHVL01029294.1.p1  ORF type:complete len:391 (-),score=29.55 GHVL01029294.1:1749-2921(-)
MKRVEIDFVKPIHFLSLILLLLCTQARRKAPSSWFAYIDQTDKKASSSWFGDTSQADKKTSSWLGESDHADKKSSPWFGGSDQADKKTSPWFGGSDHVDKKTSSWLGESDHADKKTSSWFGGSDHADKKTSSYLGESGNVAGHSVSESSIATRTNWSKVAEGDSHQIIKKDPTRTFVPLIKLNPTIELLKIPKTTEVMSLEFLLDLDVPHRTNCNNNSPEAVRRFNGLLEVGVVEEINYQDIMYISPSYVQRKDGECNVWTDFQSLNTYLMNQQCSVNKEIINNIMIWAAGYSWKAKLTLSNAFFMVPMDKKSVPYLATQIGNKYYAYKRMPWGLSTPPGYYNKILSKLCKDYEDKGWLKHYSNKILTVGGTKEQGSRRPIYIKYMVGRR